MLQLGWSLLEAFSELNATAVARAPFCFAAARRPWCVQDVASFCVYFGKFTLGAYFAGSKLSVVSELNCGECANGFSNKMVSKWSQSSREIDYWRPGGTDIFFRDTT